MHFPIRDLAGETQNIEVNEGQVLFVAGVNGSGKSTLALQWARNRMDHPVLTGNREVSFEGSAVSLSPSQMQRYENSGRQEVTQDTSRTRRSNHNNQYWLATLISRLDAYGNHCMREENQAHREGDPNGASAAKESDPIVQINQIFQSIGLGLVVSVDRDANYNVTKIGRDDSFGIDKMSDGERAALILISTVILAGQGQTITVDEPERHMHRSVSSPLLRELFRRRSDLIWIVVTHDVALLRDFSDAKLLVLYDFDGAGWRFDLLESTHELPDEMVDAIYGAREKVLFVEGDDERSLDQPLYQILFPDTTIKPRGSCNEVQRSVEALNSVGSLNSMEARGLVDADNRNDEASLSNAGIAVLGVYAIESLYFHPLVVTAVAEIQGKSEEVERLLAAACAEVSDEYIQVCANNCAERALRAQIRRNLPRLADLNESEGVFRIDLTDINAIGGELLSQMTAAKTAQDWAGLVRLVRIKGTQAPRLIVDTLGLTRNGYAEHARRVIAVDERVRAAILRLVPNPFA